LGQRWNQNDFTKYPGPANLEFLPPILPGLGKEEFMARLESDIETRSIALLDIGKVEENDVARAKRETREAKGETS